MSARHALLRTMLRTPGLAVTYHDVLDDLGYHVSRQRVSAAARQLRRDGYDIATSSGPGGGYLLRGVRS
ncbi:MAG TPA: hypothetical protein PLS95_15090 [Thermoanaerobaculales bacterium]|nr:hypothetical protein [Thermoanaerobaculales bacterium]